MTPTAKFLLAARERIAERDTWTRYTKARNGDNVPVDIRDSTAVRFCLYGALEREFLTGKWEEVVFTNARTRMITLIGVIANWNDRGDVSHTDVVAKLDYAISMEN